MLSLQQGVVYLPQALTFQTVEALLPQGYEILNREPQVIWDLSRVKEADSAGLALLIAWCRKAKQNQWQPRIQHIPASLQALMAITNVRVLLKEFIA